jgi:transposase InsO family protein
VSIAANDPLTPRSTQVARLRYTERLAEAEAVSSVGSRGDSYDSALAETVNGLYKAELINRYGLWRSVEEVELATADWVHFWNNRRLHSACGDNPAGRVRGRLPSAPGAHRGRLKPISRVSTKPSAVHRPKKGGPWPGPI